MRAGSAGLNLHIDNQRDLLELEIARAWLDHQFTTLDCEPLRASGKVLTADKILVVTQAAGAALLGDAKWAAEYVAAVSAALGKPMIRVDVPSMAITY
ncbi:hypothetical protein JZU54_04235 [bacterium]|nr:hypothetical protein [bacterium]